ncbi:hypothetical protein K435DRAFT_774875 [Dendrothele bispora CBS 962.96]|uniref:Uncharacterized protein n=1 Tax=Dendrothele bispora (strain CBS 962.96) TaxID=1314807 RepID=A0A4V4HHN8_DENBC|nr:hypothetical protein K435DRAFT_774875 [Dendrothele bispora CBS 962.96]
MTVDQVLEDLHENPSNDPEAAAFIGLFRLLPAGAPGQSHTFSQAYAKATSRFPPPTILNTAWRWVDVSEPLPQNTQVYRIYDATKVDTSSVLVPGLIPLYDQQNQVYKGQLWRLHRSTGLLLTFVATHLNMGHYAMPNDEVGYEPPEECLKTWSLLRCLSAPARMRDLSWQENQLPSVPEGHQVPKSISDCSSAYQNTSDEPDNLEKKEARPRKIDMSKVKAYVEEYLQSLKDVDFIVEPVDDLPSFDDLDTLAPHPALTPLAEDPDEDLPEWWMWGPSHSSKDAIELATNRHERNPCWMQKKNYSIENGTITFSDESRGTHPFRPSLFHY